MSQHDLQIENANGAAFRADINAALQALGTLSAGLTPPSTTYPFMVWADTTNDVLKVRNAANTAWISVLKLSTGASVNGVPVGSTIYVPSTTPPPGYLKKNGSLLLRADYPELYAFAVASGNMAASDGAWTVGKFSPGDGSTTFRIPDGRGEIVRGWDDGRGVDSGRALGSWQDGDNKAHTHGITDPGHSHALGNAITAGTSTTGVRANRGDGNNNDGTMYVTTQTTGISIQSSGGTETRMRNVAELACIKY